MESEILKCPQGDLVTFFDKIGKHLVKNYQVMKDKSFAADIITTVLDIPLQGQNLQHDSNFIPSIWRTMITENLQQEMKKIINGII